MFNKTFTFQIKSYSKRIRLELCRTATAAKEILKTSGTKELLKRKSATHSDFSWFFS